MHSCRATRRAVSMARCRAFAGERAAGSRNTPPWKRKTAHPDEKSKSCVWSSQAMAEMTQLKTLPLLESIRTTPAARGLGRLYQSSRGRIDRLDETQFERRPPG